METESSPNPHDDLTAKQSFDKFNSLL
jgi:hypothetical protein